jgi:hypothetical protein
MPKGTGDTPSSTAVMTPSCPWKKPETVVNSTSFRELMDGDLAAKLQKEEEEKFAHEIK